MITTLARKSLRARWGRNLIIGLAILAGVAFTSGSFVLADSMKATFDELVDSLVGDVDLYVRAELTGGNELESERDPIPGSIVDDIAEVPGVAVVAPGVQGFAEMIDPAGDPVQTSGAPKLAVSWEPDDGLNGVTLKEGRPPSGIEEVAIDKATADRVGFEVGDDITVAFDDRRRTFEIVGLIGQGESDGFVGATTVAMDFDTAVEVLDRGDLVNDISVVLEPGTDIEAARDAVADILPDRTEVITGEELAEEVKDQIGQIIDVLRIALLTFAVVTAFVAAFVINNIYGITIGQRLRELALLRAVGTSGSQIRRLVVMEALVVAVLATAIGVFGGFGVATMIIGAFNAAGGGFPDTSLVLKPLTVVVAAVVGIGITLLSVLIPAVRASRIPPVAAMRPEIGFDALRVSRRLLGGGIVTGIGVVMFLVGIFARPGGGTGLAVFAGGGALLTFLGVTSLSTTVASPISRAIGAPIQRLFGTPGRFARDNASRSPRRTARTASALMIGVAMIATAAVFAYSLRSTFTDILDRSVTADYIVWDNDSFQPVSPNVAEALRDIPELTAVSPLRTFSGTIDGTDRPFSGVDPVAFPQLLDLSVSEGSFDDLTDPGTVMVYRDAADDLGIGVGDAVDVTWQNGVEEDLTVVGLFDENVFDTTWVTSVDTIADATTLDLRDQFVLAKRADDADPVATIEAMRTAVEEFPSVTPQTNDDYLDEVEGQLNQLLFLVTMLLMMAIAFSFLGIAITLALSVFERTREIGLLRAVGMTRRQLRRAVRWESVIVALFGVTIGIVVGTLFGVALTQAIPDNVIDQVTIPWTVLAMVVVFAVIAATVAAWYPARKASKMDVLEAIATE